MRHPELGLHYVSEIIAHFDQLMWVIELLYSVPSALCEEIARAAAEELAERLSIPD